MKHLRILLKHHASYSNKLSSSTSWTNFWQLFTIFLLIIKQSRQTLLSVVLTSAAALFLHTAVSDTAQPSIWSTTISFQLFKYLSIAFQFLLSLLSYCFTKHLFKWAFISIPFSKNN